MQRLTTLLHAAAAILVLSLAPGLRAEDDLIRINMRDADIRAVIQWVAEQTHKQIVIDPRVTGKITVLADQPMTVDQAYQIFLTALNVYGYAAAESNGILRIAPANQMRSAPRDVVQQFERLQAGHQVVYVMTPENVSATHLNELIKPLVSPNGASAPFPASNALLIADDGDQVKRLAELVRMLDANGSLDFDVVRLEHADAKEAADVAASLFKPDSGADPSTAVTVSSDNRTNSVLIAGNAPQRRKVLALLERIDQPLDTAGNTRVIYLHYLKATELVPVLKGMTGSVQKESKEQVVQQAEVNIEASESTNALVITAPPAVLDQLADVVAKLDIRRAQVLVEAVIVEVSQELTQSLGVEWNTSLSGNGLEGATRFGLGAVGDTVAEELLAPGLSLGVYRHGSLRALLRALASTSDANILSTPSVITLDNQEAKILVGSNIPLITGQSTGSSSSTENPFTTFERQDIGVTLKITPQINRGDAITLDILQEVESVADTTATAQDVVTNKRSISTKVLVEDNAMLVLGGLISDEVSEVVDKVPLLGDLPLVGGLFRSTTDRRTRRNLMVFIHPRIVTDPAVADEVTRQRYEQMRDQQLKYSSGKLSAEAKPVLPEFETIRPNKTAPAGP